MKKYRMIMAILSISTYIIGMHNSTIQMRRDGDCQSLKIYIADDKKLKLFIIPKNLHMGEYTYQLVKLILPYLNKNKIVEEMTKKNITCHKTTVPPLYTTYEVWPFLTIVSKLKNQKESPLIVSLFEKINEIQNENSNEKGLYSNSFDPEKNYIDNNTRYYPCKDGQTIKFVSLIYDKKEIIPLMKEMISDHSSSINKKEKKV